MPIPGNHRSVMPYLIIEDGKSFIEFVEKVFDAELTFKMMREDEVTIMHGEVQIDDSTIMFAEATDQWTTAPANLFVYTADADKTYDLVLANGGSTVMELSNQVYGRTCGVKDPGGNVWWITTPLN